MKSIVMSLGLILTLLPTAWAVDTSKPSLKVDAQLYFIPNETEAGQLGQQLSSFQLFPGYMAEFHSTKNDYFDNLQPGGYWDLELRLNKESHLNVLFYKVDKSEPLIDQDLDLSGLGVSSHVLLDFEEGQISLNIIPRIHPARPEAIDLTADNFGLDHLCFNYSAVILDESFYLGQFTGFGERLVVGVPELNRVELSMKRLKEDWEPIGTYMKGTIHIELDGQHLLQLLRVGLGPSGYENGGPFVVYGKVSPSPRTKEQTLKGAINRLEREYSGEAWKKFLDTLIEAKKLNPYVAKSAGTIGSNYRPPLQLENAIGNVKFGQKCGILR